MPGGPRVELSRPRCEQAAGAIHHRVAHPSAATVPHFASTFDPGSLAMVGCDSRPAGTRRPPTRHQIALAQALHFVASTLLSVLQNGQTFTGAASSSLMKLRAIRNTTSATITKTMSVLMKAP